LATDRHLAIGMIRANKSAARGCRGKADIDPTGETNNKYRLRETLWKWAVENEHLQFPAAFLKY